MPDGDDEVLAEEDRQLADLDDLVVVDVAHRLEHDERDAAVELELRPLVGADRVLDGELRQLERAAIACELVGVGSCRPIQTKPSSLAFARRTASCTDTSSGRRRPPS